MARYKIVFLPYTSKGMGNKYIIENQETKKCNWVASKTKLEAVLEGTAHAGWVLEDLSNNALGIETPPADLMKGQEVLTAEEIRLNVLLGTYEGLK